MKTLTEIEAGVRHSGAEGTLSLTSDSGLEVANRVYRGLAAELPWGELRRKDTSIATTAGTASYALPPASKIIFLDRKVVEIQDGDDEDKYKIVALPKTELELNLSALKPDQNVPDYHVYGNDGEDDVIEFAPAPRYDSKTVRITGTIEPEPLVDGEDATVFLQRAADDALEHLIAADFMIRDLGFQRSQPQIGKAQQILGRLFGKEAVPLELLQRIVSG